MKIALFCKCGAGAEGEVDSPKAAEKFRRFWYDAHKDPECGDCDKTEALAARKRKESGSKQ